MDRGALHRHRGRLSRRALSLAALVAPALLLGACGGDGSGSTGDQELCDRYDEVVTTAEDFGELDAEETSADELRSRAEDFRDRIDELQAVAERERVVTALSNLEKSLDAARDAAAEAGDKADERLARAEDSLKEVNEKWARVQTVVADRC